MENNKRSRVSALVKEPKIMVPILFLVLIAAVVSLVYIKKQNNPAVPAVKTFDYHNEDFAFSLKLPESFEYFQTQRKKFEGYTDIEVFVPTADRLYAQEVAGYGKPLTIRIYEKAVWDTISDENKDKTFEYQGIRNDLVYLLRFWDNVPDDWNIKWNKETEKYLKDNFIFK